MTPIFAEIDGWILGFSLVTVVVTIWMGFWAAKKSKTASDFFVAGRSVSVGWNASAISGEYLSAASFMGVAGMVMSVGYDALWYPVCYACGYLFLLLFIAGPLRRFGAYTVPDLAEGRFDSPMFRKIAVVFVLFIGFFYTMPQMKGAGTTLSYIFPGLPYWAGVVVVGAIITFNVALGGMKGITLVQAFQYWAKMFAISVPIFILMAVYGHYGKQLQINDSRSSLFDSLAAKGTNVPPPVLTKWLSVENDRSAKPLFKIAKDQIEEIGNFGAPPRGLPNTLSSLEETGFVLCRTLGVEIWTSEEVDRNASFASLSISNLSSAQLSSAISTQLNSLGLSLISFKANACLLTSATNAELLSMLIPAAELGRKPLPEKAPKDEAWISPFGKLTTKAATAAGITGEKAKPFSLLYTYSLIMALVCGTAGLPHILVRFYTNPDGVAAKRTTMWVMILIGIFYVFPPMFGVMGRNLLPELYSGIGAKGTDKIVLELPRLLNEKVPHLGSILSGVTCAGAFAAFMSTFSGLLVSMTGAMAHDVYGRMLNPRASAEQRLRAFKIAAVVVGGVAILLGTQVETLEINFMVGQAFAIAAASYFPFLFMCAWWRNLTMKGAATGMLTGGLLALGGITLTSISDIALKTSTAKGTPNPLQGLQDFWVGHPGIRIICEQPAIWAVPLAIILMIVVSKLTRKDVPQDIRMKMLVLHAPEKLGLKQEYIQEHQPAGH